jgi:hypothetical protein
MHQMLVHQTSAVKPSIDGNRKRDSASRALRTQRSADAFRLGDRRRDALGLEIVSASSSPTHPTCRRYAYAALTVATTVATALTDPHRIGH